MTTRTSPRSRRLVPVAKANQTCLSGRERPLLGAFAVLGVALVALVVAGLPARAQEAAPQAPPAAPPPAPPATLVLDPDSVAALAVKNSLQLQVDAQTIEEAEAKLRQAAAGDNFRASFTATGLYQGPKPALPAEFSSFFVAVQHIETLTVTQPLWTAGKAAAQRALARRNLELAGVQPEVTKLALAKLARDGLFKLKLDERLLDVDYQTLAGLMEHERVTDKRYKEGLIAFFEVAQAQAQVAAQQRTIAERQQTIEKDRADLRHTLTVAQTTPLAVNVGAVPERPPGALDQLIAQGLENRPEMRQYRRRVELAEAAVDVSRRSLRPTVAVNGQFSDETASLVSVPVGYQITLTYQQPIWDGGVKNGQVREQRAKVEEAQLGLEAEAQQVAYEVAYQYYQLAPLQQRITVAETEERAALEQLRIARLRYAENLGLGEEVITAQASVDKAQNSRANAEIDLQQAISRMRLAMGLVDLQEAKSP